MKKYTLSIGLFDKDTKKQEITTEDAMRIASDACLVLGGATIVPNCIGVYTHDDGTKIVEPSMQIIIYGAEAADVKKLAKKLAALFNQESIAYEETEIVSEFITAE